MVRFLWILVVSLGVSAGEPSLSLAADLPVRKVVLYKHGVGFFERSGTVPAEEPAELRFKATDMDDVLKSLAIASRRGAVTGVRYESSDPLAKKLESFPFRVGEAQPLSRILDQFKGARLRLRLAGEELEGTIISSRSIPASEQQPERDQLILLMDNGEMRSVDPGAAAGLRFVDPRLATQFKDYLELIAGSRNRELRGVTIETSGNGPAELVARYVVPTPVWKSSYRLVFDGQRQPLLEGWAIVDNTSGEDWTEVTLSLVSGLPVSFVSRLYEPRYVDRPVVELPQDRAQRPVIHGGAVELEDQARRELVAQKAMAEMAAAPAEESVTRRDRLAKIAGVRGQLTELKQALDLSSTLVQTATAAELGDLFEYRIAHPVTIRKGESAMLPFSQQRVTGRKLLIFNEAHGSQHPLAAVELTNTTGNTLDGGAITVLDEGAYGGEALFETIKAGDKRLVSYAVDLGTRITTAFNTSSKMLSEFTLRRGLLTTRRSVKETRTYTIHNVDQKPKTLVIEQAARPEYEPLDPKPAEKTANSYRYEAPLGSAATVRFPVTEERVVSQSLYLTNLTYDQLAAYVRNKELNEAGRKKLEQVAAQKRQIADLDEQLKRIEQQIQELFQDQERLRRNISSLRSVSGQQQQVQAYAQKLSLQESELAGMRDRQAELRQQKADLEKQLNTLIETLEI